MTSRGEGATSNVTMNKACERGGEATQRAFLPIDGARVGWYVGMGAAEWISATPCLTYGTSRISFGHKLVGKSQSCGIPLPGV